MKQTRYLLMLVLCTAVLALSGCTTTYAPSAGTADIKKIPDLPPGTAVVFVNSQPASDIILLGKFGGSTVNGNLHVWTERLILCMKDTLKKKKVAVNEPSPKVLKISIDKAVLRTKAGGWAFECALEWKVQLGDDMTLPLTLETGHWKPEDAANVAVRLACQATLQNEQVQAYLNAR